MPHERPEEYLFLSGQRVPAGRYREKETGRLVRLCREGLLPPNVSGRTVTYTPVPDLWKQLHAVPPAPDRGGRRGRSPHN